MKLLHFEYAPAGLAEGGEGVVQNVVERFALGKAILEHGRLALELLVAHGGVLGFELLYYPCLLVELF